MIPVSNPRANYLAYEKEIRAAILHVLDNSHYVGGKVVERFEKEFADYIGAEYAIGVNSGTDALIIAMRALGISILDEVITTANTALATVAAIIATGAKPVLIDVNNDGLMDVDKVCPSVNTNAIIPVHLYGKKADYPDYYIPVIEDCAQACGADVGNTGIFGCFSFYPTKNLGAIGDGGMIVTSDKTLAKKCRYISQYGWNSNRTPQCIGINSRLDPIQAAILSVKLKYLDAQNIERCQIAACYIQKFIDLPIVLPSTDYHVFHQFVIQCDKRDELMAHLKAKGIQTAIHYPVPIHKQPVYRDLVSVPHPLTNTERLSRRILSLPMYPELTLEQVEQVIDGVRSFF